MCDLLSKSNVFALCGLQPAILEISKWSGSVLECETLSESIERVAAFVKESGKWDHCFTQI